jgi:hypothetical protein
MQLSRVPSMLQADLLTWTAERVGSVQLITSFPRCIPEQMCKALTLHTILIVVMQPS